MPQINPQLAQFIAKQMGQQPQAPRLQPMTPQQQGLLTDGPVPPPQQGYSIGRIPPAAMPAGGMAPTGMPQLPPQPNPQGNPVVTQSVSAQPAEGGADGMAPNMAPAPMGAQQPSADPLMRGPGAGVPAVRRLGRLGGEQIRPSA
jgi:hypothetical protein